MCRPCRCFSQVNLRKISGKMKKIITGITLLIVAAVFFLPASGIADAKPEIYLSTTKGAGKISVIIPDFEREGGFADPAGTGQGDG